MIDDYAVLDPQPHAHVNERVLQLVTKRLARTSIEEREALLAWFSTLREIRDGQSSALVKAQASLRASVNIPIVIVLMKALAPEVQEAAASIRKTLWDERSWSARLGLAAVTLGAVTFAGEGAGIAALGSAVGVPLWLVFGAGGTLLGTIIDELQRGRAPKSTDPA